MSDLDDLAAELMEFAVPEKKGGRSAREERIIAGFEDIQRFVDEHGRLPQHGEDNDIFERLYAVRLDRLRALDECRTLLSSLDHQGLLQAAETATQTPDDELDDDALLAELEGFGGEESVTVLRHVRTAAEKRAAEEIANRTRCEEFDRFKPRFDAVKTELKVGIRQMRSLESKAKALDEIQQGAFFVIGGQIAFVAEVGEPFTTKYDRQDSRLRVIYDNETESNVLMRSFQRSLYRDASARVISDPAAGPLFGDTFDDGDVESGTIYVLRSLSSHPFVAEHRTLIHKIGVTGGAVQTRIANAEHDATYLLAKVEVVASYKLVGIDRTKLENLLHRIFLPAQLDLTIQDRFGHPVRPREWFLVPLAVIDDAVEHIRGGTIAGLVYDPATAQLVPAEAKT